MPASLRYRLRNRNPGQKTAAELPDSQTLPAPTEPRAAGVAAVPAPFAELAADLSRRVPDFHCAAGDASGRVARLLDAPGDRAGVLVKPLPAARMPRPIMQSHAQMPWIHGWRKKRRIAPSPGGSGGRRSTAVLPASGGSAPEAGAIRVSRSMFRKGGHAEPAGAGSSSCRSRPAGRASARRA